MDNNAGYGEYPIHTATQYGATKCLEYMHQNGENINLKEGLAHTSPIHMSIGNGHYETLKWLLKNGANPNAETITDTTPLIEITTAKISEERKIKMTQLLLDHGANPCKFSMFRKGNYGTKETTSAFSQTTYLKASHIAFHKGE